LFAGKKQENGGTLFQCLFQAIISQGCAHSGASLVPQLMLAHISTPVWQ
jgi:hypothetical protein